MRAPTVEVPAPERGGEFVQSLARGLDVITAFDATHRELTLTEVAARTGLTRATARRCVGSFGVTSTMRALPCSSRWVSLIWPALKNRCL